MCSCHGYMCSQDVEFSWTPANMQLSTSGAPGHKRKLLRCQAALGPGHVGPLQRCTEEMELQWPSWQGLHVTALHSLQLPIFNTQCASRATLLERKIEPMPRVLPWTLHLGLSPSQTLCRGSSPKELE